MVEIPAWLRSLRDQKEIDARPPYPRHSEGPPTPRTSNLVPQLPRDNNTNSEPQGQLEMETLRKVMEVISTTTLISGEELLAVEEIDYLTDILSQYFIGRRNTFALQTKQGTYYPITQNLTASALLSHILGEETVGTYVINEKGNCNFVVWDIDEQEPNLLYKLLAVVPQPYFVEQSGNKGYHVWVFYNPPISSFLAYDIGQAVAKNAGIRCEAFPKQPKLSANGLGNLVKLPFGIHKVSGRRSMPLMGEIGYTNPPSFPDMPRAPRREKKTIDSGWLEEMFDGVKEGAGRNNALNKFVFWLLSRGFPQELIEVNAEWVNENIFVPPLDNDEYNGILRERKV